jgi:hypothetical protein
MKEYKPRIADQILAEKLDIAGSMVAVSAEAYPRKKVWFLLATILEKM